MNDLTRNECSTIFKARTRMLDIKNNFRGKHENILCRMCKDETETQEHRSILNECPQVHTDEKTKIFPHDIFNQNSKHLKETSNKIHNVMNRISNWIPYRSTNKRTAHHRWATRIPGVVHDVCMYVWCLKIAISTELLGQRHYMKLIIQVVS